MEPVKYGPGGLHVPVQLSEIFLEGTQLSEGLVFKEAGRHLLYSSGGSDREARVKASEANLASQF